MVRNVQNPLPSGSGYEVIRRGVEHPSLIIQPKGKAPSVKAFHWAPVRAADAYAVHLFDSNAHLLWQAEEVTATTVTIPEEIVAKLKRNTVYRWQVKAYRGSQELTSDEGEFSIP